MTKKLLSDIEKLKFSKLYQRKNQQGFTSKYVICNTRQGVGLGSHTGFTKQKITLKNCFQFQI